jgi:Raf kinase inhibitor-like YbhB/YbcL family protein
MKKFALLTTFLFAAISANATEPLKLDVKVTGISNGDKIPAEHAFCIATKTEKSSPTGKNISPEISWNQAPEGTKSFAIIVVDKDVPTDFTDAGVEGKTIKADMPRQNFYHWGVANISAKTTKIEAGKGKDAKLGTQTINDYANFMKDKPAKTFAGYDGPCPPFNDERIHNYYFQVYALNVEKVELPKAATTKQLEEEIQKHIIAKGESLGTYSLFTK